MPSMRNHITSADLPSFAKFGDLPPEARITFYSLSGIADDYGRYVADTASLKAAIWPLQEEITADDVSLYVDALIDRGLVCRYQDEDRQYLHVLHWVPTNPGAPDFPPCPVHN